MRIALRVFLSYVLLSLLLGAATLLAAWTSLNHLVTGVMTAAAEEMGREIGLFLTAPGRFDTLTPEQTALLQRQVQAYAARSERVETILVVDNEGRIRFASDPLVVGQEFRDGEDRKAVLSNEPSARDVGSLREITVPLRSHLGGRIGALRVRIIPDYYRELLLGPPREALWIFAGMVVFITLTGILLASLLTIPIRRLNRTLGALQASGAAARVAVDERDDFAPALRIVRGMGERLEALAASSASSELALSRLTRALEQGVIVVDAAGRATNVNEPALRLLGIDPASDDTAQRAMAVMSADPRIAPLVEAASQGQECGSRDLPPDEDRPGVRVSTFPLHEKGEAGGAIVLLRELGTAKALETYLQEAGRLSLLARLHATVMHEIKNPLQAMVVNVEAMRTKLDVVPLEKRTSFERNIDVTVREIYHMDDVIRDYLGLAAETDQSRSADVPDVIDNVVELLGYEARKRSIRLAAEIAPGLPKAPLPPVRLKQALLNLCLNAIQAMQPSGVLTVRARPAGDDLVVEVEDTGPGIPDDVRSRLFEFSFTTRAGGSGLGLPIVRTIVEAAGGTIELDSVAGRGATFRLCFPVQRAASGAQVAK